MAGSRRDAAPRRRDPAACAGRSVEALARVAEVLLEELGGACPGVDLVLASHDPVALVLVDAKLHGTLKLAQRRDDLLRLADRDARVVAAVDDEKGSRDGGRVTDRRDRLEERSE